MNKELDSWIQYQTHCQKVLAIYTAKIAQHGPTPTNLKWENFYTVELVTIQKKIDSILSFEIKEENPSLPKQETSLRWLNRSTTPSEKPTTASPSTMPKSKVAKFLEKKDYW